MSRPIREAVIRGIAKRRRVSFRIAAEIYSLKSIREKDRLCAEEALRQLKATKVQA